METEIGWTWRKINGVWNKGYTFNPHIGCSKVSPGCKLCFAEVADRARFHWTSEGWGQGKPRKLTSVDTWKKPLLWNKKAFTLGTPLAVFCASLSDILDEEVSIEWFFALCDLIRQTPNLDWLLLTKRPQNWKWRVADAIEYGRKEKSIKDRFNATGYEKTTEWLAAWLGGQPPINVQMGISAENQEWYTKRMKHLALIPSRVRWISAEPLLGPITIDRNDALEWVIVGGESSEEWPDKATPMAPDDARKLLVQCRAMNIPFYFKQWGEWAPLSAIRNEQARAQCIAGHVEKKIVNNGRISSEVFLLGRNTTGKLLDGREYDEMPIARKWKVLEQTLL